MSVFADHVFPYVLELAVAGMQPLRARLLAEARGRVLEIGIGNAHNLPFYPRTIESLTAITPDPALHWLGRRRVEGAPFPVTVQTGTAEAMPFADEQFDTVVGTLVFCTIPDALAAAREVRRVLKPGGRFLFFEHVRSPDPRRRHWQDRLNPLHQRLACGCRLNRDTEATFRQAGLSFADLQHLERPGPPVLRDFILGSATRHDRQSMG